MEWRRHWWFEWQVMACELSLTSLLQTTLKLLKKSSLGFQKFTCMDLYHLSRQEKSYWDTRIKTGVNDRAVVVAQLNKHFTLFSLWRLFFHSSANPGFYYICILILWCVYFISACLHKTVLGLNTEKLTSLSADSRNTGDPESRQKNQSKHWTRSDWPNHHQNAQQKLLWATMTQHSHSPTHFSWIRFYKPHMNQCFLTCFHPSSSLMQKLVCLSYALKHELKADLSYTPVKFPDWNL